MEEENVNDFTSLAVPDYTGSLSAGILPGLFSGMDKIAQGQSNLAQAERKKNLAIAEIDFDPGVVWDKDQAQITKKAEELTDIWTNKAMQGDYDVDDLTYGPFAREYKKAQREFDILTKRAEENQAGYQKVLDEYKKVSNQGDRAELDVDVMEDWIARFNNATTLEERNKMLNDPNDSPYQRNYSEWDLAIKTKPLYSTDPTNGMKYMDEDVWGNRIYTYITGQDGAGYYEKHKLPGESPETFADRMAQKFGEDTQLVPDVYRYNRPRQQSGSGRGSRNYGFIANVDKATGPQYSQSKAKNILYIKTPQGKPPSSKAGVVRQRKDPNTGQMIPTTEQITVNSIYYDANNALTVSIIRYDKYGKQIGSGENVPYLENRTDYNNFAGFDLGKRLDDEIAAEEARQAKSGGGTKPAAKSSGSKSTAKKTAAQAMREAQGKK